MFGNGDGSAPEIVCPWAGLCQLNLAIKAANAAMKTRVQLGALMLIVDDVMDGLDTNEHQLLPVRVAEEVVVAK